MDVDLHPKMLKRLASIYVDKVIKPRIGEQLATEWANRTLKTRERVKELAPYIQREYEKRGLVL